MWGTWGLTKSLGKDQDSQYRKDRHRFSRSYGKSRIRNLAIEFECFDQFSLIGEIQPFQNSPWSVTLLPRYSVKVIMDYCCATKCLVRNIPRIFPDILEYPVRSSWRPCTLHFETLSVYKALAEDANSNPRGIERWSFVSLELVNVCAQTRTFEVPPRIKKH
ncbi:hypothetical protein PCH_Pc21g13330 [Penicillium rubens Wisconsin 54-1255]|jgi:hypothetical protein|uniref:Uncharacterized protein n=1 Tax=Penicillium rubens (strain ATCC 28089 / DSM 1075 / NRRL 1951 / Wisconsin 54-1255) TaxID=500485 RepID=B6HMU3_PENRW|nr:hypothetical protein PCH_Pc21g13330 [Penicillium rubens Wisconsin 54-1255]